jgi:hypothetical protein
MKSRLLFVKDRITNERLSVSSFLMPIKRRRKKIPRSYNIPKIQSKYHRKRQFDTPNTHNTSLL